VSLAIFVLAEAPSAAHPDVPAPPVAHSGQSDLKGRSVTEEALNGSSAVADDRFRDGMSLTAYRRLAFQSAS
jgi:hypothetical protein